MPWFEVEKFWNLSVELSHSLPISNAQKPYVVLDCKPDVCDEVFSPHPPPSNPSDPSNCEFACSYVSNIFFDVHEDQVLDGVVF